MGAILVVDDERSMREFLAICLKRAGHAVTTADSVAGALTHLDAASVDIVITDLKMEHDDDGLRLLREVRSRKLDNEVIVVTAYATPETAITAMKQGAYDYLTKPFKVDEINAVIERALEKRALVHENQQLRQQVEGRFQLASLLGKSPRMQRVFELIRKVHSTRTTVLITGESGTGKELVARALHTEGSRADAPFVAVNCGAIPDELMESELFGHVKGAFTGAVNDKDGLFSRAHGGVLFLDEIGELSLNLQVKLLRALQERTVKPVGAVEDVPIDVRLVAATNRELEAEVERGSFRSDLYYRLNVIELRLPPLRHRSEDVPMLIEHFLRRFATEQGKPIDGLDRAAQKTLQEYDFPGNVRELENIIERAVTLAESPLIGVEDLPQLRTAPPMGSTDAGSVAFPDDGIDLDRVLADYERSIIERALEHAGGVRKKAAALLGITFRSMRYRLNKLGIEPESQDGA